VSHGGGHGGSYDGGTNVTIWSTAYDHPNGSQIYIPSIPYRGVWLNYTFNDPDPPHTLVQMNWNGSVWTYNITGIFSQGNQTYYWINVTDYAGNNEIGGFWWFTVQDQEEPAINEITAMDYGNSTVLFQANVTDVSQIQFVELNYTYLGVPHYQNMTYNAASGYFEYTPSYIPWDTQVLYTVTRASDIAGNVNTARSNIFETITTEDQEDPVISETGFDEILDVSGHLRFYANVSDDYSGLDPSEITIKITRSTGPSNTYPMTFNGSFYIYETTDIPYWEDPPTYSNPMEVTYNVTVYDNSGRSNNTESAPIPVPDSMPPVLDDYAGVEELTGNEARFWTTPQDGNYGSQVSSNASATITLYWALDNPTGYNSEIMTDNGTHWTTGNVTGFSGDKLIFYFVNVTDGAGNRVKNEATPWTHRYGDQTRMRELHLPH
jgi:hypothetical protein